MITEVITVKPATQPPISATEPDWSREQCRRWWDPSRQLLKESRKNKLN